MILAVFAREPDCNEEGHSWQILVIVSINLVKTVSRMDCGTVFIVFPAKIDYNGSSNLRAGLERAESEHRIG